MKLDEKQQNDDGKVEKTEEREKKPNLKGDWLNIVFIVLLCTLQGLPMGISLAVKAYMQNMKVSYVQQAKFGVVDLPYSLKLLWAPLMDAVYSQRIGKRKTWLVPVQFFIGLSWMFIGSNLNQWLTVDGAHMSMLTCMFFCVNVLASTQDIAIDGWAITILRRENVGYASTCITSGQSLGMAFGYVFFILLESESFCNKWLRFTDSKGGLVTMEGYLFFWGAVYIVATLSMAVLKRDKCNQSSNFNRMNVAQTYRLLWEILKLPTIKNFVFIMTTYEFAFSSLGSTVSNPKFMEYGVAKEDIAVVDMSLIPIRVFVPLMVAKYTTGPTPLNVFHKSVPVRMMLGICSAVLIYYTPNFLGDNRHDGALSFFMLYEVHRIVRLLFTVAMYLGVQAFFSRISDPRISGTYMSLLNTVWYFGVTTSRMAALGLLNPLTVKRCSTDETNTCRSPAEIKDCELNSSGGGGGGGGGKCSIVLDGYFVEVFVCTVFGLVWYLSLSKILKRLQSKQISEWRVEVGVASGSAAPNGELESEDYILPELVNGGSPPSRAAVKTEASQTGAAVPL